MLVQACKVAPSLTAAVTADVVTDSRFGSSVLSKTWSSTPASKSELLGKPAAKRLLSRTASGSPVAATYAAGNGGGGDTEHDEHPPQFGKDLHLKDQGSVCIWHQGMHGGGGGIGGGVSRRFLCFVQTTELVQPARPTPSRE